MSKKIIRRAKEAAKDRIRSVQTHVQAERKHQSRSRRGNVYGRVLPPPPALKNWSSSPKSSGVQLSSIDEDFEVALREDEFSNPFFDEPAGWQVVEHPSHHHSHSGGLEHSESEEDLPELEEQQGDPLLGQVAATLDMMEGEHKDDRTSSLEQHALSTPTSADVSIHTPNSNGLVLEHTESQSEAHLETVPLPLKPHEPEVAVTMEGSSYETKDTNDVINSSKGHQHTHVPAGQTDMTSEESRGPLPSDPDVGRLPRDCTKDDDDLDEAEFMTEPGLPDLPSVEELLEHSIDALKLKDHISPHDSPLSSPPSSDEGEIRFEPSHPNAAIIEQEVENVEVEESKPQTSHVPSEETHGTKVEVSEAHVHAPRVDEIPVDDGPSIEPSDNNSSLGQQREGRACSQEGGRLSSSPAASSDTDSISDSRLQTQSNSHPLFTSATKHPLIPDSPSEDICHDLHERRKHFEENGTSGIGSFEYIDKDDLFPIQEDYFAVDQSKQKSKKAKPLRPSSPPSRPPPPTKRNSEGKMPPPRPNYSPNLQRKDINRKLGGTQGAEAGDKTSSEKREGLLKEKTEERAQVKLLKPLGSSPPNLASISPLKQLSVSPSLSSGSHLQNGKQPNDKPFTGDLVKQRDVQKLSLSSNMQDGPLQSRDATKKDKTVSENKNATIDSDESQQTSLPMAYHLLLAGILYLYYSLNFSDYLAGLLAGFLLVYLTLGVAFVYYVHQVERSGEVKGKASSSIQLSESFVKRMNVNFDTIRVYQSSKFTAAWIYDHETHHPRHRVKAKLELVEDFTLTIKVWESEHFIIKKVDIRHCSISLVPPEVAENRKRRWSKKFPIKISWPAEHFHVYIFTPTSRVKEDWFRRLRSAASGIKSDCLIKRQEDFFSYMQQYFPADSVQDKDASGTHSKLRTKGTRSHAGRQPSPQVQYRVDSEEDSIRISKTPTQTQARRDLIASTSAATGTSVDPPSQSSGRMVTAVQLKHSGSLDEYGFTHIPRPPKQPKETDWVNALAARLCWDVWHDERWKTWVMSRIQRKLIRVKTPPFMEQLRLTDIKLGNDMPVINSLHDGPKLDLRGIWVYLDVTYEGLFVMTIETKLKFGKKEEGEDEVDGEPQKGPSFSKNKDSVRLSPQPTKTSSHGGRKIAAAGSSVDPDDEIDSGSDEEGGSFANSVEEAGTPTQLSSVNNQLSPAHPHSSAQEHTSRKKTLLNVVTKIGKRVVNTKIVRKAAEKAASYPLVLTVEVKRLDGVLVVNIPPPQTDTIWYGFKNSPKLELVAKPKLGQRQVTLSHVTHWIENKLRDLVDKKLLFPNMEDLVIPILNSGLPEDVQKELAAPPTPQ